jgi:O-succinylbenzoic acid--CoA ligase
MGGMLVALRGLLMGSPVTFLPGSDPVAVGRAAGAGATFISVVPAMLARLLEAGADLRPLRAVLVGGDGLPQPLAGRAAEAGVAVVSTYGLTESCGGVVYDGRPLDGIDIRIAAGGPGDGEPGEILLRGPTVFERYRGAPEATAAAFAGPWLRTRDAGALAQDRLQVFGRLDDVIVTGGEKVWPGEVEAVLRLEPAVRDVAVVGLPDPVWGSRVVAHVVPADPTDPPTRDRLQLFARERLARHKVPREVRLVEALPTTRSGKVRRSALEGDDPPSQ